MKTGLILSILVTVLFSDIFDSDTISNPIVLRDTNVVLNGIDLPVRIEKKSQHMGGEHSYIQIKLFWEDTSQVIYAELGSEVNIESRSREILLIERGDRHSGATYNNHCLYTYNEVHSRFEMVREWNVNNWELYIDTLSGYLDRGDFESAHSISSKWGVSYNGNSDEAQRIFQLWVDAVHDSALILWRNGFRDDARETVLRLGVVPFELWETYKADTCYTFPLFNRDAQVNVVRKNQRNTQIFNNLGFFLTESGHYKLAENLLLQVLMHDPERAVVYLNLGDLYGDHQELLEQGHPGYWYFYHTYCDLMVEQGKQHRIPERLRQYIK
ncbi:MAG: tetratricopeptide repeat protein [Fibrobacterota bacterium]